MTATVDPPEKKLQGRPVPRDVQDKLQRGRTAKNTDANLRALCVKFWQGKQNYYLDSKNNLQSQALVTRPDGSGKPPHRIRNAYDFVHSIVEGKVSAASQRVPGYEVTPSSVDPDAIAAARLASQVAYYGYDKWRLRRATTKVITNALVQREAFAMPYFDPNVGPFVPVDGELVGMGEIRVQTFNRSEVMWEPGEDFDDSRWHAVERARLITELEQLPGFVGGTLNADARTSDVPTDSAEADKVVTTDFMERPCPKYPQGRRMLIANDRVIVAPEAGEWEPHPCIDANGEVSDEPALHRLSYTVDPEGDDRGLVEHLLTLARTIDDCWNKLLEWKNRCLNPQMMAPVGSLVKRKSDEPGAVIYYRPVGAQKPEWERTAQVPSELFQIIELALTHMRAIAADIDVQPDPNLAAKTANAAIETNAARWQSFLGDVAEFHSRLMRNCLVLVARHYSEQRQLEIRGQYGWEPLASFTGRDLRSQVNVRVLPGSIEAKSRQTIQSELQFIQANWPGAITPEAALAALHGGSAEGLLRSYELDVARANLIVQRLREGPEAMASFPPRMDAELGGQVPGWMPRKQDNLQIWKQVIGDFTKTPLFDSLPVETQHMFELVWSGLEWLEQARAAKDALQQQMQAQSLGMDNAAKPQGPPPLPDRAGFTPQ